jgi:hypothetical protein
MRPDPAEVRAVMVARGLRGPDDTAEVTPPEYRLYAQIKTHETRRAELAEQAERRHADAAEAAREREHQARVGTHAWQVKAARAWAQANGLSVATRGRVPATVMAAFNEAVEKGEINVSTPPFTKDDEVTHRREPNRVGTVVSVTPDRYSNEYVTAVRWIPDGPAIPYRSGLTLHRPAALKEPGDDS